MLCQTVIIKYYWGWGNCVKSLALFSGARRQSGCCQHCLLICKISSELKMKMCCSPGLWLNFLSISLKCFLYIAHVQMFCLTFHCVFFISHPFSTRISPCNTLCNKPSLTASSIFKYSGNSPSIDSAVLLQCKREVLLILFGIHVYAEMRSVSAPLVHFKMMTE